MLKRINWGTLAISVLIPLVVGGISALLTMNAMEEFSSLDQPPLSPPGWLFPVVWSLLYILMGIAFYRVVRSGRDNEQKLSAIKVYFLQLAINFLWSILFFNFGLYTFSVVWLALLLITVVMTAVKFYKIDRISGYLFIPYIIWILFAAYLNIGIAVLN